MELEKLKKVCQLVRHDILTSTTAAGSGHPTSSLSGVELMTTLFFGGFLRYDLENPGYIFNDRIIFSKGHAAPLLYSLYQAAGVISHEELLTLRQFNSRLEGHPTPEFKYAEAATGSLGQGLSIGVGMALGMKLRKITNYQPKVYVLLGDSEVAEGQVWEAMEIASHYKLNNLVAILDVNRLGQRGETMLGWDLETYKKRAESFGWNAIVVEDGHNLTQVKKAFDSQLKTQNSKPTMIIAKTIKGKGVSFLENKDDWHGKAVPKDKLQDALDEFGNIDRTIKGVIKKPKNLNVSELLKLTPYFEPENKNIKKLTPKLNYEINSSVATREAYGDALVSLAERHPRLVVLDAETSNSTLADKFKNKFPDRFLEMFIAEQNMVSVAVGLSKLGFIPYISSFAAFLSRSFDQIRMAQYSEAHIGACGSHAGVSIGYDGSSQMALEDISMFRSILESTVFYPSDATSMHRIIEQSMVIPGVVYIRSTREKTPVLYDAQEKFFKGGSKIIKQSEKDVAVVFTAGITLHEALKAYEELKKENIFIAVVDLYSIKPIDLSTIHHLTSSIKNIIVVEDHYPTGGIGEAVLSALHSDIRHSSSNIQFTHLAVSKTPHSASPQELLSYEEIDSKAVIRAVKHYAEAA